MTVTDFARLAKWSDGINAGLAGADADNLFDIGDEDFSVADAPGLRRLADRIDDGLRVLVGQYDLDFDLRQEIDDLFSSAVEFRVALLTAETLGFRDRDTLQANFLKGFLHFVQLERLNDRFDLFHEKMSLRFSCYGRNFPARRI